MHEATRVTKGCYPATGPRSAGGLLQVAANGVEVRRDLFTLADPKCTSRVTAPVLWDKASRQVVSNESSEIRRAWGVAR